MKSKTSHKLLGLTGWPQMSEQWIRNSRLSCLHLGCWVWRLDTLTAPHYLWQQEDAGIERGLNKPSNLIIHDEWQINANEQKKWLNLFLALLPFFYFSTDVKHKFVTSVDTRISPNRTLICLTSRCSFSCGEMSGMWKFCLTGKMSQHLLTLDTDHHHMLPDSLFIHTFSWGSSVK
jgi:hypothetical protein